MKYPVNDQKTLKIGNLLTIMRALRDESPLSRNLLQRKTGLSWGSISSLVGELMNLGLIREAGPVTTGVGRRPVDLELNTAANHAIGLWLSRDRVEAVLLDLKGTPVRECDVPLDPGAPADELVEKLHTAVGLLTGPASPPMELVAGIGIAVPGVYDPAAGVCRYAPNHPGWSNVPLRALFEERYGAPVFIDHDLSCCVLGEHWFGIARDLTTFCCVYIEGGIGAGIMIHGKTYRGIDNTAGELGHVMVDPGGPRCACGRNGCLEVYASGRALLSWLREHPLTGSPLRTEAAASGDDLHLGLKLMIDAAGGDKEVLRFFDSMGRSLGTGIAALITLLNPETVVLGGSVCDAREFFLPAMEQTLRDTAWSYSRIDIRFSTLKKAITVGAAGMVLDEVFNNALLFH